MGAEQEWKREAAYEAVRMVRSGMVVGLGTGSTSAFALERLAELIGRGELGGVVAIPSSLATRDRARELGIELTRFECAPVIDLTIDGADEVDPALNLIKGGGGALLREKIVAQASRKLVIVVDEHKLSPQLGCRWPVPVEIIPFARVTETRYLESLGAEVRLREAGGEAFRTDQENLILDARFGPIEDPHGLAERLSRRAGVVEHGLFLDMTSQVIVAGPAGLRRLRRRELRSESPGGDGPASPGPG